MPIAFHPIPLGLLKGPVGYIRPRQVLPEQVTADNPAVDVMTDLKLTAAVTVSPAKTVDDALQVMVHKGVRMLLVEDLNSRVMGLITATDIQGEKPMLYSRESGVKHSEILVRDIMVPIGEIEVMEFGNVEDSLVGDIVATLTQAGRQHALVVEPRDGDSDTLIRGIFSTSQISKQMGIPIEPSTKAQTFVELETAITH
jgi:CBS domain containing-hemolysin-like protein